MIIYADENRLIETSSECAQINSVGLKNPLLIVSADQHNVYTKIIDDEKGVEFFAAIRYKKPNIPGFFQALRLIGAAIAKKALAVGITEVDVCIGAEKPNTREKVILRHARKAGLKF